MPRKKMYQEEETGTLSVRLPLSIREKVEKRAQQNRRSLNQEMVWMLQFALETLEKEQPEEEK